MKKYIAAIILSVFTIQVSTQTHASDPIAQKKELMKCYDQLFDQSSKAVSKFYDKDISLDSDKKLEYLRIMTVQLMNNISKDEVSDKQAVKSFATLLGMFAVGGAMVAGTRYFVNKPLVNEYNDLKQMLRSKQLTIDEIMETRIIPRASYLNQEIAYKANTGRYLAKSWIVLMVAVAAVTIYLYEVQEDFSQEYRKVSFLSLLTSTSIDDFEDQLFISSDPTSIEIGKKLLKSCNNLVQQDMTSVMKNFNNITEKEMQEAILWMGNP